MPLYTYRCENEHDTTQLFPISKKKAWIKCPECQKRAVLIINWKGAIMGCSTPARKDKPLTPRQARARRIAERPDRIKEKVEAGQWTPEQAESFSKYAKKVTKKA